MKPLKWNMVKRIYSHDATLRIVADLVESSQWFAVEPMPDDEYEISVTVEVAHLLPPAGEV